METWTQRGDGGSNITGSEGTLNRQAKSAARSAFESTKQRFFGHLLTSMKTPTLIRSIDADLEAGHARRHQIVSTGEALMERRLAKSPPTNVDDISVDVTPREYVGSYSRSIPSRCNSMSPLPTAKAICPRGPCSAMGSRSKARSRRRRDEMLGSSGSLPPVPGALDRSSSASARMWWRRSRG
ncbi:MAG: hypothetical protein R3D80_13710 [Paracoccaceae bacterium]